MEVAKLGRAETVGVGGREDDDDDELCDDLDVFDEDEEECHVELLVPEGIQPSVPAES